MDYIIDQSGIGYQAQQTTRRNRVLYTSIPAVLAACLSHTPPVPGIIYMYVTREQDSNTAPPTPRENSELRRISPRIGEEGACEPR